MPVPNPDKWGGLGKAMVNCHKKNDQEFSDVQAGFRKGRGTQDHFANGLWKRHKNIKRDFIGVLSITEKLLTI